jgi:acetyl esterase
VSAPWVTEQDLAQVRLGREEAHREHAGEPREPVAHVEDVDAGEVPARLYVPEAAPGVLLFAHGGGFVFGDRLTHDGFSRRLANRTGWGVLLVDYRRAPEHPWPAAAVDLAAAADWLAGQDWARRAIVGDSAGAALALGEVMRHPTRYEAQVLVYPFVDPDGASYDLTVTDVDVDAAVYAWFWRLYLQGADTADDAALHVLDGRDLTGLPRTLVQLAEHDVLTPTGQLLAGRLEDAGVPTELVVVPGVEHGFWRRHDEPRSEECLAGVAAFLRR